MATLRPQVSRALSEGVGLVDMSSRALVAVAGADRASFLHNLCTNEIRKLADGSGAEAFFLDARGRYRVPCA